MSSTTGEVICFASAKGGTGKTVIALSAAYLLASAGRKVLLIDSDFSTRGLSIFLLAKVLGNERHTFSASNCLAESFLDNLLPKDVVPLEIHRDSVTYHVILSNHQLWMNSVPDDRLLGTHPGAPMHGETRYYEYLNGLCDYLKTRFDHIIIDTRGGYDYSSAAPALVADKLVVVIENNIINKTQFLGLIEGIQEFGTRVNASSQMAGLMVNKAIFSPSDKRYREEIKQHFGYPVLSTIPADLHLIRSYQDCRIPLEQFPESDFSRFAAEGIETLVGAQQNWRDEEGKKAAELFKVQSKGIIKKAKARQLLDQAEQLFPHFQAGLVVATMAFFLLYVYGGLSSGWYVFILGLFASLAGGLELMRSLRLWPFSELRRFGRLGTFGAMLIVWIGFSYSIYGISRLVALSSERSAQKERAYEALYTSLEALADRGVRLTDAARIMRGIPPVLGADTISHDEERTWSNEALYVWVVIPLIVENNKTGTARRLDQLNQTREWSKFYALRAYIAGDLEDKRKYNEIAVALNDREVAAGGDRSPMAFNNLAWAILSLHKDRTANPESLLQAAELAGKAIIFDKASIAIDDNGEPLRFVRAAFYDTRASIYAALADARHPAPKEKSWRELSIEGYNEAILLATAPADRQRYEGRLQAQRDKLAAESPQPSINDGKKDP